MSSTERIESFGAPYALFGLFAVINYIIPYFMWSGADSSHFALHLIMRLCAAMLCFGLLMHEYWPKIITKYLPFYWHFTMILCLPFFATFMLFDNNFSDFGLYNIVLALFLLAALTDWVSFTSLLVVGSLLAYTLFALIGESREVHLSGNTIYTAVYMYSFAVMIGILFARRSEKIRHEKMEFLRSISASIAREKRPLLLAQVICKNIFQRTVKRT